MCECGIWYQEDLFENGRSIPIDVWGRRGLDKKYCMLWRGVITAVKKQNKQAMTGRKSTELQGTEPNRLVLRGKIDGHSNLTGKCLIENVR